jgi:hypothetical protein
MVRRRPHCGRGADTPHGTDIQRRFGKSVQLRSVDIGFVANADAVDIAPDSREEPDGAFRTAPSPMMVALSAMKQSANGRDEGRHNGCGG